MNDEQLSALMDDELAADASREAVAQLLTESQSRATWGRYHLIGAALRGTPAALAPPPDNVVALPRAAPRPVSRIGLGLAAAAVLAAVVLIVSPQVREDPAALELAEAPVVPHGGDNTTQRNSVEALGPSQDATTVVNQTFIVRGDETQQRMNSYVSDFNEQRARQPTPGVHPYVRNVGYETH